MTSGSSIAAQPAANRCRSRHEDEVPRQLLMLGKAPTCTQTVPGQRLTDACGILMMGASLLSKVSRLPS